MNHIDHTKHTFVAPRNTSPASAKLGRPSRRARLALAVVPLVVVLSAQLGASAGTPPKSPFPASDVTFTGHGNGPGYGMGQWGAFGYAALDHWTFGRILGHFYYNPSAPVSLQRLSRKSDNTQLVNVVIEENDNDDMTVASSSAFRLETASGKLIARIAAGDAARAVETEKAGALTGEWDLETATTCNASKWKVIATKLSDPVAVPASLAPSAPASDLLTLCRGDGLDVTYRGKLEAFDYYGVNTDDQHLERTINIVGLEEYVADVTPGESPAGWGTYGGTAGAPKDEPWGFQELEAQAVAVRSYVLYVIDNGGWYGYASICDDICQYYARGIQFENPLTTLAASDTKGVYVEQSGGVAPTEYESSSGGYTETLSYPGGPTISQAVPDLGDHVCIDGPGLGCNPWHAWTASIPVATIERQFPAVGTLESVKVTATDSSGRVGEIEIIGEKGSTSLSGATFVSDFDGFWSTMFSVTNGPGAGSGATSPAGSGATSPAGAAGTNPASLAGRPGFRPPVGGALWRAPTP